MLSPIWRINLNQEGSQLKKSKHNEVSVGIALDIWLVPRFYHVSSVSQEVFYHIATGSVNNRATSPRSARYVQEEFFF